MAAIAFINFHEKNPNKNKKGGTIYTTKELIQVGSEMLANYVDKILSFSRRRTCSKDEAEELTQEIFLQAAKNIATIKDMDKFEAWLWGVANNTLKSFRRERGRERRMYSSEDIDAQICNDEAVCFLVCDA